MTVQAVTFSPALSLSASLNPDSRNDEPFSLISLQDQGSCSLLCFHVASLNEIPQMGRMWKLYTVVSVHGPHLSISISISIHQSLSPSLFVWSVMIMMVPPRENNGNHSRSTAHFCPCIPALCSQFPAVIGEWMHSWLEVNQILNLFFRHPMNHAVSPTLAAPDVRFCFNLSVPYH